MNHFQYFYNEEVLTLAIDNLFVLNTWDKLALIFLCNGNQHIYNVAPIFFKYIYYLAMRNSKFFLSYLYFIELQFETALVLDLKMYLYLLMSYLFPIFGSSFHYRIKQTLYFVFGSFPRLWNPSHFKRFIRNGFCCQFRKAQKPCNATFYLMFSAHVARNYFISWNDLFRRESRTNDFAPEKKKVKPSEKGEIIWWKQLHDYLNLHAKSISYHLYSDGKTPFFRMEKRWKR